MSIMLILERFIIFALVVWLIYWILTSKRLELWIKRKFFPQCNNASEISDKTKQIEIEKETVKYIENKYLKDLMREQRILNKNNKNNKKE